MQAHFLSLYLARIAGDKTGLSERAAKRFIVAHQGPGNAVTNGTGLSGTAAAGYANRDIDLVLKFSGLQRLPDHHTRGLSTEVGIQASLVHGDVTGTASEINTGHR